MKMTPALPGIMYILLFSALFGGHLSLAQGVTEISGDSTPDAIPNEFAYRMVLNSLALRDPSDMIAVHKQELRLKQMGLSDDDRKVLATVLSDTFLPQLTSWETDAAATQAGGRLLPSANPADRDVIVTRTISLMKQQLSSFGYQAFEEYVKQAKTRMKYLVYR